MDKERQEIIDKTLVIAKKSLSRIEDKLESLSSKELISVFNTTTKAYRYLKDDVQNDTFTLSSEEKHSVVDLMGKVKTRSDKLIESLM